VPVATAVNVALLPACTLWFVGWVVMLGATFDVPVTGNANVNVTELPVLPEIPAVCPFIVALSSPVKVCPVFAVSTAVTVYCVPLWNGLWFGLHVTVLTVKLLAGAAVAVWLGVPPVAGAITPAIIAVVMGVSAVHRA